MSLSSNTLHRPVLAQIQQGDQQATQKHGLFFPAASRLPLTRSRLSRSQRIEAGAESVGKG
jgi:hypothetical protein